MKQGKRTRQCLGLAALMLCAVLCAGIVSAALAAGGYASYVNFDANGGSDWMNSISIQNGQWIQPESEFTCPGFRFIGWSTSPAGPVQYLPGDVAYVDDPGMPESGSIIMYAIWGEMSAEQLAGQYTPRVWEPYSYDIDAALDDETGAVYLTAELSWNRSDIIDNVTVTLNWDAPDGPRVPCLAGTFSKEDGSITSSSWYDKATVAIPYVPEGEEQVITDGAVNGVVPGNVIYATVASQVGETAFPGNPVILIAKAYPTGAEVEDNIAWLEENGCATITRNGWETTISLLEDTILPEGGITLGDSEYHLVMNTCALTGTLTNGWGQLYVEHLTPDGRVLAGYASGPQTVTFNSYGYSSGNCFGSASVKLKNYGHFYLGGDYMDATVTNGALIGTANVQGWGYVNSAEIDEYEKAPLTENELAAHTPKNVTVTPQEDGLIVECDYEPEAVRININVDVILSDGNPARLISDSSSSSSKDQVMSLNGGRQPFFLGGLRRLSDQEEQTITENGEQKYINGFRGGDILSVTMNYVIGQDEQETPWSSPEVRFTYSSSAIGRTYAQGSNVQVGRNFLPEVATLTVTSPPEITYLGQPVFLDYTLTLSDGTPLVLGEDYTEEYINNYQVGQATLSVIGLGNYSGRMTWPYTISAIPMADVNVTLATPTVTYNGSSQTPSLLVIYDGIILSQSSGYYASYENNINAGTATITLTPGYNHLCAGEKVVEFTILPRTISDGAVYATLSENRFEWAGAEETYEPSVSSVKWGDTELEEDEDFTVSYENNTAIGMAYVVLTGIGNYAGSCRIPFTIYQPVDLATAVAIDPLAPEIYTGSALEPEVTVRAGQKILTKGWDYSVAYSNNVNAGEATVTVTGRRDYTGQASTTFQIDRADLGALAAQGKLTMTLKKQEYPYGDAVYTFSGGENKPQATLTLIDPEDSWNDTTLYENTSYTLSYENNIEAGTATAIATGMGNYGGMCTAPFTVSPQNLNDLYYNPSVAGVTYNGQALTPAISMYTTYQDTNGYQTYYYLTEGVDYTIDSWANNVNAGTATVTVTGAGNNFIGTRQIDFTISPFPLNDRDFDLSAVATVSDNGPELHHLTGTRKQDGRNLVVGTDFTVENLDSDGDYATFYLRGTGNYGSSTGTYYIPFTETIGTLPASGTFGSISSWEINANGVMTITGQGTLSKQSGWAPYAGLVKKIVVHDYAGTNTFTAVSSGTFEDFINCTECTLPEHVTAVSPDAFPKNSKMVVHLPDGITTFNTGYSSNFEFVKALVHRGSTTETTIRNSSYSYFGYEEYPDFQLYDSHSEDKGLMLYRYFGNGGTVTIPDCVDSIEGYGFSSRYGIEKVIIPGSVKKINMAFLQNCYDLREIVIQPGNSLTELPNQFISGCYDITLYLPDNITEMPGVLNYYSSTDMLIVANCDSAAIQWAKNNNWKEESTKTSGPRYRAIHRNPTVHPGQAPTCEAAGWTEYVTCTTCGCNTKVDLPALGHSWSAVTYTWNNSHTQVTATRVCGNDATHVETETVAATSKVTKPATCLAAGERTYTSAMFTNPVFRVQKYVETLPMSGHSWRTEASTAASGSADGLRGGAVCEICGEAKLQQTVSVQKVMRIPAMMKAIEAEAFMGVAAEQINVLTGTVTIGDKAFADCDDLKLVLIPASVTTIQGDPFSGSDVAVICPDRSPIATWCDSHGIPHNP